MSWFKIPALISEHLHLSGDPDAVAQVEIERIRRGLARFNPPNPQVSIVVPAYNEERVLLRTLSSFAATTSSRAVELIVVNNNSNDRTQEILDRCGVRSIFEATQGIATARQRGLEQARGEFVLSADADTIYPPGWVDAYVEILQDPSVACVYGTHSFLPSAQTPRFALALHERLARSIAALRSRTRPYLNVLGFNSAYRRADALRVGGLNPNPTGRQIWEDGDLAHRLMSIGTIRRDTRLVARVWTSDRRLVIEGGLWGAFFKRVAKHLRYMHQYLGWGRAPTQSVLSASSPPHPPSPIPFVFVGVQPIGTGVESTLTSLAREIAKTRPVLYVDPALDQRTVWQRTKSNATQEHLASIRKDEPKLRLLNENLWALRPHRVLASINWIPWTWLFALLNRRSNRIFAQEIREAVQELGFRSFVLVNDMSVFRGFHLKEMLSPLKYVYFYRDNFLAVPYWRRHGWLFEPRLIEKSDVVICNSSDFEKRAKTLNPRSYFVGHGFNVEAYNSVTARELPSDLGSIPRPRVGYVGALIETRLDVPLIVSVAKLRPAINFVFVGEEDRAFRESELHSLPNVHFLGTKLSDEVPAYIQHFDVCVDMQVMNDLTQGNFPLKVVEYLALGKPVVVTPTNVMRETFARHCYLANGPEAWARALDQAIKEDSPELARQRIKFNEEFSYARAAQSILTLVGID